MDVAGGRSAGFGRIGGELRPSAFTPLQLPSTPAPAHTLPVVRRSTPRSWTMLGTVAVVVIALALVATLALKPRAQSSAAPRAASPSSPVDVQAGAPHAPTVAHPRG